MLTREKILDKIQEIALGQCHSEKQVTAAEMGARLKALAMLLAISEDNTKDQSDRATDILARLSD